MRRFIAKRLPRLTLQNIKRMFVLSLVATCLGLFAKITLKIVYSDNSSIHTVDSDVIHWLAEHRVGWINIAATDLTALGSSSVVTLLYVVGLVLLLLTRDRLDALQLVIAAIGSGVWTGVLKHYFERSRPTIVPQLVEVTGYSYPSGHALTAATMYLTLALIACRYVRGVQKQAIVIGLSLVVVMIVAFTRVYLGVHYPSDITSGVLFGWAWALLLGASFSYYSRRENA